MDAKILIRTLLGLTIATLMVSGPVMYLNHKAEHRRHFRVVEPGRMYRSGQLSQAGLERAIEEYGIRTVVTFRYASKPGTLPPDHAEEVYCRSRGLNYVRVQPRRWSSPDGVPAEASVDHFLRVISEESSYPILIHCFAGIHRTGTYCALYRIHECGWTPEEALREMRGCGYTNLSAEWDVYNYVRTFQKQQSSLDLIPEATGR